MATAVPTILEREDWTLFRSLATLAQKAGVPLEDLPRVVVKELVDNSLDVSGACSFGPLEGGGFYVEDEGEGIPGTDEEIGGLFSVSRPLASSKLLRLPTRGALGNGLRVVTGAVLASNGSLVVSTRGRKLRLRPRDADGETEVERIAAWEGRGTRVDVTLGEGLSIAANTFAWAERAAILATGPGYSGRSSSWWYDSDSFYELLQAHGDRTVRDTVASLDGCSGWKAGEVAAGYTGRAARSLSRDESDRLLLRVRELVRPVRAARLGYVGTAALPSHAYVKASGSLTVPAGRGRVSAEIPFIVEVWARQSRQPAVAVHVNRTPITAAIEAFRWSNKKTCYGIFGAGLEHTFEVGRTRDFEMWVNVLMPHMPITTDGKAPDLLRIDGPLLEALKKAARKVRRTATAAGGGRVSQKDVILDVLVEGIAKASGNGEYRYSQRQLFYAVRPHLLERLRVELDYNYFGQVITDHESERGSDLPGIYRDARGTLYHPHLGEEIALGTLAVEEYRRPPWTFNRVLYAEKEGLFPILRGAQWPERHDCALLTSKGYASRAVRDLIDLLGETSEEITVFAIHDADGPGTRIYESLQEATRARPGRKVRIINLGLEPEEAVAMGLQVERLEGKKREMVPAARYVPEKWRDWLQSNRVELNAMSTPEFLGWLEKKMRPYARKVIPPKRVMIGRLREATRDALNRAHVARVLQEARVDERVDADLARLRPKLRAAESKIAITVETALKLEPAHLWTVPVDKVGQDLARSRWTRGAPHRRGSTGERN